MNVLLFLCLLINLFAILLARLLRQWAHQYIRFIQQPGCSPAKRARIRVIFFEGVDKYRIFWVVEALPTLRHLSICLFIVVLNFWLFNINQPIFYVMTSLIALPSAAYLWWTPSPLFFPNSPFYSPPSPTIWSLYTGLLYVVFKVLSSSMSCTGCRFDILRNGYRIRMSDGIGKTAEKLAWERPSEIDLRILILTLDYLREDGALEKFFEAIPSFFNSAQGNNLQDHILFKEFRVKFRPVLDGFLERTSSSGLISEPARSTQLIITCLNATYKVLDIDEVTQILVHILNGHGQWGKLLQSVEMAHSLRGWGKSKGKTRSAHDKIIRYIRRIVTQVVAGVRLGERGGRWISLAKAKAEFGIPDNVLWDNIAHGDSALLSFLVHLTREAFHSGSWTPFVLNTLTQFDVCNTLPELQREFCSLWNEILREAWRGGVDCTAVNILREIRSAYIGLHQGTDAAPTAFSAHTNFYNPVLVQPRSYRFCNFVPHRPLSPSPLPSPPPSPLPSPLTLVISIG